MNNKVSRSKVLQMDGKTMVHEENVAKQIPDVVLNDQKRKRKPVRPKKKKLRDSILKQMEFYFSDAALTKDRYLAQLLKIDPFIPIDVFLKFNKIRELTHNVIDISKALKHSHLLVLSEDGSKVKRSIPLLPYNSDERTIYVESIPSTAGLPWLTSVFQKFGPIAYISLPKFHNSNRIKGFAFVEYKSAEDAQNCVRKFTEMGCKLPTNVSPDELGSVKTFEMPSEQTGLEKENVQYDHKNIVGPHKILTKRDNGHKNNDIRKKTLKRNRKSETSEDQAGAKESEIEFPFSKRQKTHSESDSDRTEHKNFTGQKYPGDESLSDVPVFDDKKKNKQKVAVDSIEVKILKSRHSGDSLDSQEKLEEQDESTRAKSKAQKQKKTKKDVKKENDKDDDKSVTDNKSSILEMETITASEDEKEYDSSKPGPSDIEDTEEDKKKATRNRNLKKRKKAKMHHDALPEGLELGLQILPKAEWKVLRNKYLMLQRKHYTEMKKALRSKSTNQHCEPEACSQPLGKKEEQTEITQSKISKYSRKCPEKISGIVVMVTLPEPCIDIRGIKVSTKSNVHVMHVEIKEGQTCMFVRFDAPDYAKQFADSGIFSNAKVLSGEEEDHHWERIKAEWESRANGGKRRMRGGDRLRLKITQAAAPTQIAPPNSTPASQAAGKHLRFDE